MRHDHHRPSFVEGVQLLHDLPLVVGVQSVRGLVQEDEVGILVHRPGDQDTLSLPLAHSVSLHADLRIIAQRERIDEIPDIRHRHGMQQAFLVHHLFAGGDVVGDRIREDKTILHDRTGLAAPYVGIQVPEGGIADPHVPLVGVVKTEQEFHDRRLPAPAGPYDGGHPVMGYRQVDILQHVIPVRAVIAEAEVFQP